MTPEHTSFSHFRQCALDAPDGTYIDAKELSALIGEACDNLMAEIRALGLKADNCDLIWRLEAAIYDYVKCSNPTATVFPVSEGFGSAMNGPARERVLAQAENDRDFIKSVMVGNR